MGVFKRRYRDKETGKLVTGDYWFIDYRDQMGRRVIQKAGPSKRIAEQILAKRLTEVAEDRHLDRRKMTRIRIEGFAEEYLTWAKVNHRSYNVSTKYKVQNILVHFRGKLLCEITSRDVEDFKAARASLVKPATTNRDLACLSHIFTMAIRWGKATANPCQGVKKLLEDNRRTRFLSQEEIAGLLEAAAHSEVQYLRPIIVVALNTAMRLGEILNLRWEDLDLGSGMIHILKSKSGKGREIPMSDQLRAELSRFPRRLGSDYVFLGKTGEPLKGIRRSWQRAVKEAGIEGVTFHTLRHTAASYLVMGGVDLRTVQEILGHADIRVTMRYAHLSPAHKAAAVQKLGNLLETSPKSESDGKLSATGTD